MSKLIDDMNTNIISFTTGQAITEETPEVVKPKNRFDGLSSSERCVLLRKIFKEKGWSNRKVSVTLDRYSMGASIDVTVKSIDVDLQFVKTTTKEAACIDYCEHTGEILSGGNLYTDVQTSYEYDAALVASIPKLNDK